MGVPRRILIVEDEPLIAMMLADLVEDLGHEVHDSCDTLDSARAAASQGGFDLAILDIHLGDDAIWSVVDILAANKTPFLLASGGHLDPPPQAYARAPIISKPYSLEMLGAHLEKAFTTA